MKTKLKITFASLMAVLLIISIVTVSLTACGRKAQPEDIASTAAMLIDSEVTEATSILELVSGCEVLPSSSVDDKASSQASAAQSTASSKANSSRSSSTPTNSTAPPASSVAPKPPASSAPPASAPWTPKVSDYLWVINYAREYGAKISVNVTNSPGTNATLADKNKASWDSPATIGESISIATLKLIIESDIDEVKRIADSRGRQGVCKIYLEPYEHDNSLLAIYFLR